MDLSGPSLRGYLFHAVVTAAYPENRTVDVRWLGLDVIKRNVPLVQSSGNYTFPHVGEPGLVIGNDSSGYYWLGKIDFGYNAKLQGEINPTTGEKWPVRKVNPGEILIQHLFQAIGLFIGNSGNWRLGNRLQDGIHYLKYKSGESLRRLQLAARTITQIATNVEVKFGTVLRSIPVMGIKAILDITRTKAAQEFLVSLKTIQGVVPIDKVKLHLGDIFVEPIVDASTAIPKYHTEAGAVGSAAALRALLAVFNSVGIEISSIKIDELGNMSINTPLPGSGTLSLNANTKLALGGPPDLTVEPAVLGQRLVTWLAAHKHPTSVGLSGPPSPDDLSTLANILSIKVFVS